MYKKRDLIENNIRVKVRVRVSGFLITLNRLNTYKYDMFGHRILTYYWLKQGEGDRR